MPKEQIMIGYEVGTGKEVWIPMFHMLVTGQTQKSGKTTFLKEAIEKAVNLGYKVLIFDTKTNLVEFDNFGKEVPVCLRETTDSLTILGLLESIMQRKLTQQYATLINLADNANTFKDVLDNAEKLLEKTKSGFIHDAAMVLADLMRRLIEQTEGRKTTATLELPYAINRMSINGFSTEGQQMIIKTAFEDALTIKCDKILMVLDESSKFLPQRYRSACDRAINLYVTQGAISDKYFWMSTQFLATTSKNQMKATDIKILGRQSHDTECEHTLDLIPNLGVKLKNENIMQLKLGHFYVVAENWVKLVYMCPSDAEPGECRQVAMGKRDPSDLHYRYTGLVTAETLKAIKKEAKNFFIYEDTEEPKKKEPEPVKLPDEEIQIEQPSFEQPAQELMVPQHEEIIIDKTPIKMQTIHLSNPEVKLEIPAAEHVEPEKPKIQPPLATAKKNSFPRETPLNAKFELLENNIEAVRIKVNEHQDNINYLNRILDSHKASITQLRAEMKQDQTIKISATQSNVIIKNLTRTTQVDSKNYEGKIMILAKEEFFSTPRALRDVKDGLEKHCFTVQETETLKKTLYNLVLRELLCSTKVKGELRYRLHSGVKFATPEEIIKASLPEEVSQTEQTTVTVLETKDVQN